MTKVKTTMSEEEEREWEQQVQSGQLFGPIRFGVTKDMERRQEVVDAIRNHIAEYGEHPSFTDVGRALGYKDPKGVEYMLLRLREEGRITWTPRRHRTLRVLEGAQ